MENIQIKEEIQEKILPSSTVEETCIAYIMKSIMNLKVKEKQSLQPKQHFSIIVGILYYE